MDYPKFDFAEIQKTRFKTLITEIATFVEPETTIDVIKEDPSDNAILEIALTAKVDFVITGDQHLLSVGRIGRARILTASDFLKIEEK